MAIGVYVPIPSMSAAQYDDGVRRLEEAGQGAPAGRLYHVAFSAGPDNLHVFDVWDSQESFDAFGQTMMPIMTDLGVDPGEPQIAEVHSIIQG